MLNESETKMSKADQLVLVTGASGYIATWVVKYALDAGYRVRGTVRDPSNAKKVSFLRELPGASERLELVALDLEKSDQAAFDKAVEGCVLVAHTASPFPAASPKHEDELIIPAVNGTVNVLKAALKASSVKRVVVTSSVAAVGEADGGAPRGEKDWTDLSKPNVGAYVKSKTLAERAAWDFMKENKPSWALATINPALVIGPSIGPEKTTSAEIGARLMDGQLPMLPKLSFGVVDVRDVAMAHIKALEASDDVVSGRRFLLYERSMWFKDMASEMKKTFSPMGYKFPSMEAPYFAMWILSFFDASIRLVLPGWGKWSEFDSTPSREVLKVEYHPIADTIAMYGHSLVFHKLSRKLSGYTAPTDGWKPVDA